MLHKFDKVTDEMRDIHERKNKDYGRSFDKSLDEDGLLVAKIRLGDKFSRFSNLIKNAAVVKDESVRDTLIDMANYAIMTVMWMEAQEVKRIKGLNPDMDGDGKNEYT